MIIFKKIRYKNFLSTGNVANSIDLNSHASTLITGKNGEGKSTILCALTFALFGKPFRNISKNQLVNSINGRNCLVEIEFETNGRQYLVKRGIKPNVFEIWVDGEMVNKDAALKDYQKVLEQQILKLNYKTFTQVVILGSATFIPFMQLSSTQRREVIEDILDIRVFSVMNSILKEKTVSIKDALAAIDVDISNCRVKIHAQKKLIEVIDQSHKDAVSNLRERMAANQSLIEEAESKASALDVDIAALSGVHERQAALTQALNKSDVLKGRISTAIGTHNHNIEFFNNNPSCPTCSQPIPKEHKDHVIEGITSQMTADQLKLSDIDGVVSKLTEQLQTANARLSDLRDKLIEASTIRNTADVLRKQNVQTNLEISAIGTDTANLAEEKAKMRHYAEMAIESVEKKSQLLGTRQLHDVATLLLKDSGIKTAIIREYLPVMNKLINKYLSAMEFYVKFELNESFQEVIKSRGRDAFTYDSFSEGEKRRLDLAILFTWRHIAKMKNSVNTNIMVLDEILDGALDAVGIDFFLSMLNHFGDNTNVFVISHRDIADKFDQAIRVQKKHDFSIITSG